MNCHRYLRMVSLTALGIMIWAGGIPSAFGDKEAGAARPIYIKFEVEDFGGFDQKTWQARMPWWPQWSRGGDSGWWAAFAPTSAASERISMDFTVPQSAPYTLWVRYEDYLGQPEPFEVVITHAGGEAKTSFGRKDVITQPQAPFPWSYAWDKQTVTLAKGPAKMAVAVADTAAVRRCLDAIILTTDAHWTPKDRGFPPQAYAGYLEQWAKNRMPLKPLVGGGEKVQAFPRAWALPRLGGRDFWYLGAEEILPGYPGAVLIQEVNDGSREAFAKTYGAKPESAPVFGSPLCAVQTRIATVPELLKPDNALRKYILGNKRPFVLVGNYTTAKEVPNSYKMIKKIFGDLWIGIISGEGSYLATPTMSPEIPLGKDFKEKQYQWLFTEGKARWQKALSADWASSIADPFEKFILCLAVGTFPIIHQLAEAGCDVLGTESAAAMPYTQVQLAFIRGAARQYRKRSVWYYGASFGDAIRSFTKEHPYTLAYEGLQVDNRNAVIGPSLAHIRRVLLHAYLQGASLFHPEQGYNLFGPDGKLNPMGWCYDEMVRLATRHPERGVIYTPIAVLLDRAHGWDKYTYSGSHIREKQPLERSDRMINGFFNVAQFPFPKNEGDPVDDLGVPWPNGYFGDIFDVLVTSPTHLDAVSSYPVVFCVGDTRLDSKWVAELKTYVAAGGTLVINAAQLGEGIGEDFLGVRPGKSWKETNTVECARDVEILVGNAFSYLEVTPTKAEVIAQTPAGDPVALLNKIGKGRVVLTTPSYLLGLDGEPLPYLAHLLLELSSGLLPVQVQGNCQYYVNIHPRGYVVVLSNNEGISKGSHAPARMDAGCAAKVHLSLAQKPLKTEDWLGEEPRSWSYPNEWLPEYTQPLTLVWKKEGDAFHAVVPLKPGEMRVLHIQTK